MVFMGLEDRVRNTFKIEKRRMYAWAGGGSQPDGINDVFLYIAAKFKIPVRRVKDIINGDRLDGQLVIND